MFIGYPVDEETAYAMAECWVRMQAWVPTELLDARAIQGIAPEWDTRLVELYQEAVSKGIVGYFVASPDSDIPGGPTLAVRPY